MKRPLSATEFNQYGQEMLPGYLGIEIVSVAADRAIGQLPIRRRIMAPNGFIHAGAIISLADTVCGYGTVAGLPDGAIGFTTIELKSNFISTAREGTLSCQAIPLHQGRTTQVWDAQVIHLESGRVLAEFRCTQLVLWPGK
jgi:1,4-dihydroxy-2-naphthoyl-CoA hydrolase